MSARRIEKYVGESIGIQGTFKAAGVLADPAAVTAQVTKPDGTTATVTPVKQSTGVWTAKHDTDAAGNWQIEITGDDNFDVKGRLYFYVKP